MDSLLEAVSIVLSTNRSQSFESNEQKSKSESQSKESCISRRACHRCGNLRNNMKKCACLLCPHVYCVRCVEKAKEVFSASAFEDGCPVCKKICCCANKSHDCKSSFHCYRKCPASRAECQKRTRVFSYHNAPVEYCLTSNHLL